MVVKAACFQLQGAMRYVFPCLNDIPSCRAVEMFLDEWTTMPGCPLLGNIQGLSFNVGALWEPHFGYYIEEMGTGSVRIVFYSTLLLARYLLARYTLPLASCRMLEACSTVSEGSATLLVPGQQHCLQQGTEAPPGAALIPMMFYRALHCPSGFSETSNS